MASFENRPISFGITQEFRSIPPGRQCFTEVYAAALALIEDADELGFGHVWIPEHHFVEDGFCPSPMAVAGAVLARTKRIHFGTHAFLLPLHNPVRVAEDVAVLDVLSGGRMELAVAMGYRPQEFAGLGIDPRYRRSLMDECCDVLIRAWTEDGWTHTGRHFSFEGVSIMPKPVQRPHPKLWVGASTELAVQRAVRVRGSLLLPPPGFVDDEAAVYRAYARGLQEAGEDPTDRERYSIAATFTCVVTDDPLAYRAQHGPTWKYMSKVYAQWGAKTVANSHRRRAGVIGTAAECIDGLAEFLSAGVPVTHVVMNLDSSESLRRFAAEVMPSFG